MVTVANISIMMTIGSEYADGFSFPTVSMHMPDVNAPVINKNNQRATIPACLKCVSTRLTANNAACPVTFVVNTLNARKPAPFINPALMHSNTASLRLCLKLRFCPVCLSISFEIH